MADEDANLVLSGSPIPNSTPTFGDLKTDSVRILIPPNKEILEDFTRNQVLDIPSFTPEIGPIDSPPPEKWSIDTEEEEVEKEDNRYVSLLAIEKVLYLKRSQLKKFLNASGAVIRRLPDPKVPTTTYNAIDRMDALYFAEYLLENKDYLRLKHKTIAAIKAILDNQVQLTIDK